MVIDLTPTQFWDNFFSDDAPFGFDVYLKKTSNWNIKKTNWQNKLMKIDFDMPLHDIPFVDEAHVNKVY